MTTDLLFDFKVDKSTKTISISGSLIPGFHRYGMLLPKKNFWTNGLHLSLLQLKPNTWILKWGAKDFMQW